MCKSPVLDSAAAVLTSQNTTQVCSRMCELVLLVVPVLQIDEDTQVMCASNHAHARSREFRAQLVVSPRTDALFRAVDIEGGDGRVVGGLFGEVRDCDSLAVASHAIGAARGRRVRCLQGGVCVFDFPVTLGMLAESTNLHVHTIP